MPKQPDFVVVTGNALMEGDVIYLTASHDWSRRLRDAAVLAPGPEAEALLAHAAARPHEVVGPYLAPVDRDDQGRAAPNHYREAIRAAGPAFRTDLGKQADIAADQQGAA